jgi:hypothetical protein
VGSEPTYIVGGPQPRDAEHALAERDALLRGLGFATEAHYDLAMLATYAQRVAQNSGMVLAAFADRLYALQAIEEAERQRDRAWLEAARWRRLYIGATRDRVRPLSTRDLMERQALLARLLASPPG